MAASLVRKAAISLAGCALLQVTAFAQEKITWPPGLPVYDHVVIVIEENKDFQQVMDLAAAPYIAATLAAGGAVLTQMFGEEHPSEGNYFWLFSGSNQGVGFRDDTPGTAANPHPFSTRNLGEQLFAHGKSFGAYSEDLPTPDFPGPVFPEPNAAHANSPKEAVGGVLYARKHAPWVSFNNIPANRHLPFSQFPTDYTKLPTVTFVIPNLQHDMHDGDPKVSVPRGDKWLQKNLAGYAQWAKEHNSLLIVTCDENDDIEGYSGLTNPSVAPPEGVKEVDLKHGPDDPMHRRLRHDLLNYIATIFVGARIKPGYYAEAPGVTHVNVLRTLEAMYGLEPCGHQQANAEGWGISDRFIIQDIFSE